jgi:hypothetical protein
MKKLLTTQNLVSFGVAVLAGVVAIALVFRVFPANIKSKITG